MSGQESALDQDWLKRFRAVHPSAACRDHDPKFGSVYVRGRGAYLWDTAGRDYLDLTCGYSAANFGHVFEPLVTVAKHQLERLTHVTGEPHVSRIELAEKLLQVLRLPADSSKVMFNTNGSRAIETAWKAASSFRSGKLLTLGPSFHGRSLATLALGAPAPTGFEMLNRNCVQAWPSIEFPYCGVCPLGLNYPACGLRCVERLWEFIETEAESISAILLEPVIGARGYILPPSEFFQRLRHLSESFGILLIADEIQSGLGRCGDWLLSQRQCWQADLVVLGKSLGGGITPISAVLGRADVLESLPPGCESETFAGSPLAAAIALEVIAQLEHGGWMQQGARIGAELRQLMSEQLALQSHWQACVEGEAAYCAIEFGSARSFSASARLQAAQSQAKQFAQSCLRQRLLVHYSGPYLTRIVLLPPLTLDIQELAEVKRRLTSVVGGRWE